MSKKHLWLGRIMCSLLIFSIILAIMPMESKAAQTCTVTLESAEEMSGTSYTIYSDAACKKAVKTVELFAWPEDKARARITLARGTYYVKMTRKTSWKAIDMKLDTTVRKLSATGASVKLSLPSTVTQSYGIVSLSSNIPIKGAEFTLYADKNFKNKVVTFTFTSRNKSTTLRVKSGKYYLKMTRSPRAGVSFSPVLKEIVLGDQTISIYPTDGYQYSFTLKANTLMKGAVYGIYYNKACTDRETTIRFTGDFTTSSLKLTRGTYYIKAISNLPSDTRDTNVYTLNLNTPGKVLTVTPTTTNKGFLKISAPKALGGASVSVYSDSGCTKKVAVIKLLSDGTAYFKLTPGKYYLKQSSYPTYLNFYNYDTKVYSATVVKNKAVTVSMSPTKQAGTEWKPTGQSGTGIVIKNGNIYTTDGVRQVAGYKNLGVIKNGGAYLILPSVGSTNTASNHILSMPVYSTTSAKAQSIIDAYDRLASFKAGNTTVICGHSTTDFNQMTKASAGTKAYLIYKDKVIELVCVRKIAGYNKGSDLTDTKGNSLLYASSAQAYTFYTCNGNTRDVIITTWKINRTYKV